MESVKINYDDWFEHYQPLLNHFESSPDNDIYRFETFGKDLEFVQKFQNCFIWTAVSCENEETWIIPGFHIVNRENYYITHTPWENENIEVNDNEMITVGKAKYSCLEFFDSIGIELTDDQENKLHDFWSQII